MCDRVSDIRIERIPEYFGQLREPEFGSMTNQVLDDPIGIRRNDLAPRSMAFHQVLKRPHVVASTFTRQQQLLRNLIKTGPLRDVCVERQDDTDPRRGFGIDITSSENSS
jgi:hypothetical protein